MKRSYWPDPDDLEGPPSEARRLIEEASRGLAEEPQGRGGSKRLGLCRLCLR